MANQVYDYENLSERKKTQLLNDAPNSTTNVKCDVPLCEKTFDNVEKLKQHYQSRHFSTPITDANLCNGCGNYFAMAGDKARHMAFTITDRELLPGLPSVPAHLWQPCSVKGTMLGFFFSAVIISTSMFYISIGSNDYIHYYLRNAYGVKSVYLPWNFNQFLALPEIKVTHTIQQFIVTIAEDSTGCLISSSVFYIPIGTNDYIHYSLLNTPDAQSVYLTFHFLAYTMKQEIKNLCNAMFVMGLAPIGCAPYYLWLYSRKNGECVETLNDMILEVNFAVRYMVSELNEELVGTIVIFCDAFEGSMDIILNHWCYGFNATDEACYGLGIYQGWIKFVSSEMACRNSLNHVWLAVNVILTMTVSGLAYMHLCATQ